MNTNKKTATATSTANTASKPVNLTGNTNKNTFSFNNMFSASNNKSDTGTTTSNNTSTTKNNKPKNNKNSVLSGLNNLNISNQGAGGNKVNNKSGTAANNELSAAKSLGPEPVTTAGASASNIVSRNAVANKSTREITNSNSMENIFMKMGNAISNNLERLKETVSEKKKAGAEKEPATADSDAIYNLDESKLVIGENYMLIMGVAFAILLLVLLYLLSKTFNVGRALERIKMFELYQKITNYSIKKQGDAKLKDVVVASSYNSCHAGFQMFSYTSEEILKQVIKSGARYVELTIFPSKYGAGAIPVVSCGYKKGQWKLMLNTTTFESAIKVIAENAFKVADKAGGAPNPNDPFFLGMNLSTSNNISCLDLMSDILMDYLHDRMLDPKYAYQFNSEMHNTRISELVNKVVILSSSGFEGSKLEELINGKWQDETDPRNNANILLGVESFTVSELVNEFRQDDQLARRKLSSRTSIGADRITENENEKNKSKSMGNRKSKQQPPGMQLDEAIETELLQKKDDDTEEAANDDTENMVDITSDELKGSSAEVYKALTGGNKRAGSIIRLSAAVFNSPGFDGERIKRHNEKGLTIVVPHVEGDILTYNYNTDMAFELGCQFVAMNYQTVDEPMDSYITKFEKQAIIAKAKTN